jgi:hypothetical protein
MDNTVPSAYILLYLDVASDQRINDCTKVIDDPALCFIIMSTSDQGALYDQRNVIDY